MNGLQRTLDFLAGQPVDRPPFHPIIMRWAAKYAGVKYRDFCLDHHAKVAAMIKCADDFGIDWVTVMSDPWAEASAFGVQVEYPEDNLPIDVGGRLPDLEMAEKIQPYNPLEHFRCVNRINEIREFSRLVGDRYFIVGWVEGPVAAYADIRGLTEAAMDFLDDPETCGRAMDVIVASAREFITLQVKAGAHCIGIGDAFCSQIGPKPYRQLAFEREKQLVDHIHALGAKAKLHICGNTHKIMPDMIATGADIIDVDHLVPSMAEFAGLLGPRQVFSGKTDPVSVIQDGTPAQIAASVRDSWTQAHGRVIVSAGCEVPPDTTTANMRAFGDAAVRLEVQKQSRTDAVSKTPPRLECRELPAFTADDLAAVGAAFAQAEGCVMRQAWLAQLEPDFTTAVVRAGWRGNSLLIFAELEDADVFTRATAHNQRMWELGDVLEIFLSPENSASYVEFHVTPNNLRLQLRLPDTATLRRAQVENHFDHLLLPEGVFHSRAWTQPENKKWFVYAEIPAAAVFGADQPVAGAKWRFSFSRYDEIRGRSEPMISSTSPHAKPDFHRREEWGTLIFV